LTGFWLRALACAAPGLVLAVLSALGRTPAVVAGVLAALVLAALGAIAGAAWAAAGTLARTATTGFGLCTGMPGAGAKGAVALTPFRHERFQAMAGQRDGKALTFGDLRAEGIDLRVMTTNLTRSQPMPMPWTTQDYFFEPEEMRKLFPEDVVQWMEDHPPTA